MKNYEVEINIFANDETEVSEKLEAFAKLNQILKHQDLINTVEILQQKPQIVNIVKEFGDEFETLEDVKIMDIAKKFPTIIKRLKE